MLDDLEKRVVEVAYLMLDGNRTVREVAKIIGISKSTVHYDLTKRLNLIDNSLYLKVRRVLDYNKKIRHIRGGEATRLRYLHRPQ